MSFISVCDIFPHTHTHGQLTRLGNPINESSESAHRQGE